MSTVWFSAAAVSGDAVRTRCAIYSSALAESSTGALASQAAADAPLPSLPPPPAGTSSEPPTSAESGGEAPDRSRAASAESEATLLYERNGEEPSERDVGQAVQLTGLKSKAELNGKRGRIVSYQAASGRFGVAVKAPLAFGGVEKLSLALLPANLRLVIAPPPAEEPSENEEEQAQGISWARVLRRAGLGELLKPPSRWRKAEEELFPHLTKQPADHAPVHAHLRDAFGMLDEGARQRLIDLLLSSAEAFTQQRSGLTVYMKLVSLRYAKTIRDEEEAYQRSRKEWDEQSRVPTAPRADRTYRDANGRVCPQTRGRIDASDVAFPTPSTGKRDRACVYPTSAQCDTIASVLRRVGTTYVFNKGEHILEGMLERRGVRLIAVDSDIMSDKREYRDQRIYCSEVVRVGVSSLLKIPHPAHSAIIFATCFLLPWEAYLSRYPTLPLVIIIGDEDAPKNCWPRPSELEGELGWRVLFRSKINAWKAPAPLDMVVYEKGRA
eukprot:1029532-Prymnesium_polylepis.1